MRQAELFSVGAGNDWHDRNKDKPRLPDPVLDVIDACDLRPKTVLEIGCGTGWRLAALKDTYGADCTGYEPSKTAVAEKVHPRVFPASALEALPYIRRQYYDTIIFGFCLYLVDREDLMFIAAGADAALRDKGHVIIHDFLPDYSYRRAYVHKDGVWSYKMHYADLWLGNPAYKLAHMSSTGEDDNCIGVAVLQKDLEAAWPVRNV